MKKGSSIEEPFLFTILVDPNERYRFLRNQLV